MRVIFVVQAKQAEGFGFPPQHRHLLQLLALLFVQRPPVVLLALLVAVLSLQARLALQMRPRFFAVRANFVTQLVLDNSSSRGSS